MSMVDTAPTNNPNKGKLLAALILGVPLLLMALATFMYTSGWMSPGGRVNNGLLFTPVIPLEQLTISNGDALASEKWQFILRVEGTCDADCDAWVVTLRQLHVALGKNEGRVERLYLSDHPAPASVTSVGYYRTVIGKLTPLDQLTKTPPTDNIGIFVSDPLGNIMMYYSLEASPKDIIEDMKKLLKLSMVG
jgi:hypothetical protein